MSRVNTEKVLREWSKRNGWEVSILPFTKERHQRCDNFLSIRDKEGIISFRIPLRRIYKVEVTDHEELILYTTNVIYTFTEIGVTVSHR